MGKRFIIGNIHGDYEKLNRLIDKLAKQFHPDEDKFIFLGDYVSYGSDSYKVIDFLIGLKQNAPTVFLLGDHDHDFLEFINDPRGKLNYLFDKGGEATVKSYEREFGDFEVPESHYHFLQHLELTCEENDFFCVHAGLNPHSKNIRQQKIEDLINIGKEFYDFDKVWKKLIIFGHTPVDELHDERGVPYFDRRRHILGLHTNWGDVKRLTCYEPLHQKFYQV